MLNSLSIKKCRPILSTEAMRGLDNETKTFNTRGADYGVFGFSNGGFTAPTPIDAGFILMKEAGKALLKQVQEFLKGDAYTANVAIFVGGGNNGGDGLVLGKLMIDENMHCTVFSLAKPETFKNEARLAYEDFLSVGGRLASATEGLPIVPGFSLIVDCMLGNGASGELRPAFAQVVETINNWHIPVIAADSPTGYDSTQHTKGSTCIHATETVLFGMPRLDAYSRSTSDVFGKVTIAPLHYPEDLIRKFSQNIFLATEEIIPDLVPYRDEAGEKREQGCALIIAGSGNMTGAAVLCTEAALRSGAGLVTLAAPKAVIPIMQNKLTEPIFCGLGVNGCECISVAHLLQLQQAASHVNAIAIGPGLGVETETQDAIRMFLTGLNTPVVIDADAINACGSAFFCMPGGPSQAIITPHKREWERNFGPLPSNENFYPEYLRQFATQFKLTIVLKGSPTYIALPDGRVYIVPARNSGMAKGGSGDVLTGILVSLLAQGMPIAEAAILGVLLHQKAGAMARHDLGPYGMLPSDVIKYLPISFGIA